MPSPTTPTVRSARPSPPPVVVRALVPPPVLATGALFLLIEPMNREDGGIAAMLALTADAYGIDDSEIDEVPDVGLAIPGTMTVLGICFALCVLMLAGLPPLPGFIGKIAMIQPLIEQSALPAGFAWSFVALLILSGFATLIGMARIGIQTFWANDVPLPRVLAFEIAARAGFREAIQKASPKLLEPIMKVEVVTPEEYTGSIIGDLTSRRGMVRGQDSRGNANVIDAFVPLANMFGYVNTLRGMSQGRAQYTMQFDHYEQVPNQVAEEIQKKYA